MEHNDSGTVRGLGAGDEEATANLYDLLSPWPALDEHLHLSPGRLIGIGAPAGSREALAGYDLARHAAAHGIRSLIYAPRFSRRNAVDLLHWEHRPGRTPHLLEKDLAAYEGRTSPVGLLVIDSFDQLSAHDDHDGLHDDEDTIPYSEEPVREIGRQLKQLAMRYAGHLTVVVMAHVSTESTDEPLTIEQLGTGADLEYDADTLLLLRRTGPATVSLLVAKDRHGPAPHRAVLEW